MKKDIYLVVLLSIGTSVISLVLKKVGIFSLAGFFRMIGQSIILIVVSVIISLFFALMNKLLSKKEKQYLESFRHVILPVVIVFCVLILFGSIK